MRRQGAWNVVEIEKFLGELKAIDSSGLPEPVEASFVRMLVAVESNLVAHQFGGDTNAANDRVTEAKEDLAIQFDRYRGHVD